jgi:hypothetical protein
VSYPVGTAAKTINYNAYSARFKLIGLNVSICGSLKNTFFYDNVEVTTSTSPVTLDGYDANIIKV